MNDLFNQINLWSRGPWFMAEVNAAACVFWAVISYVAWRRGVIGLGMWVRPIRREEQPALFKTCLRIGVAVTVVLFVVAIVQVALWVMR